MRHLAVIGLVVLCLPALAENDVEFRFEGVYRWDSGESFLNWSLEEWPSSMEARVPPIGSELPSWAGIAFSLSPEPVTHEFFRVGLAFDVDKPDPDFIPRHGHRDDRVYLYIRSEPKWLPDRTILRIMYPLAQRTHGYEWYWRVEVEDLRFDLTNWGDWEIGLTSDLSYSPDPALGFEYDYGLRLGYSDGWIAVTQDTISIGWIGAAGQP